MKEGWKDVLIGDVCFVQGGSTPRRTDESLWKDGTYPWFTVEDIRNQGRVITDTKQKVTKKAWDSLRVFPKDTILLCCTASVGEYAITKIDISSNQQFNGITIKDKTEISPMYLFYFCSTLKDKLLENSGKSTIDFVSGAKVRSLHLSYPPLPEQERIVKILDAAFEKIDRLKQNAEKGLQEVKNLWQATLKEELKPKEGWNLYTLKDIIADISYGTSVPSCENGEYVYLRMNNITNDGRLDLKGSKTITLTEKELEKCIVRKGDILFNRTNSMELVGKSCVFDQDDSMVIAGYIIRIRLQKEYDPQFVSYSMNYMRSLGLFRNLIVGAVHQANISAKAIQTIRFSIPSLEKQQSIASKFDDIFDKCRLLRENYLQEIDKYESLKQSILRKAFSGEL